MSDSHPLRPVADNLWVQHFPLRLLGTEQGRVVTTIRLRSGDLVIHSTAPFTPDDVKAISVLGRPRWLVDGMLMHDTFARQGKAAFPSVPLLAPPGFSAMAKVPAAELIPAPPDWVGELEVLPLLGMPKAREHLFFHVPSRTLIVTDLVFNFNYAGTAWERFFRRYPMGLKLQPGVTRIFKLLVSEKPAFQASMAKVMEWDFDRIITGHKEIVASEGKQRLKAALAEAGL